AGPGNSLPTGFFRRVEAREDKTASSVAVGLSVDLNSPEIPTPPPSVLAVIPDHRIEERPRLVAPQEWVRIVQAAVVGKRKIWKPPVEGICRNSVDAKIARYVL